MISSADPTMYLLVAASLMALSGVPGLLLSRPVRGQRIAAVLVVFASLLGEFAVSALLSGSRGAAYQIDWTLPFGPALLSVDHLSTLFLLPLFLVTGCVAVYSLAYWPAREQASAGRLTLFLGLFAAAMVIVVMARHGVLFLMAWEVMALSAYFLLTTDQRSSEVQRVGTVYLIATHTGTMALFVMFSLLRGTIGTFTFPASHSLPQALPIASAVIITALIGFGGKAGLMPLHFWLPGAHANAPSHVSAMMSGLRATLNRSRPPTENSTAAVAISVRGQSVFTAIFCSRNSSAVAQSRSSGKKVLTRRRMCFGSYRLQSHFSPVRAELESYLTLPSNVAVTDCNSFVRPIGCHPDAQRQLGNPEVALGF